MSSVNYELDDGSAVVTPTLKLRRRSMLARYLAVIEDPYASTGGGES